MAITEKQEHANWRNWALKTLVGTAILIEKIMLHCPDAAYEGLCCKEALKELELKIRANQPHSEPPPKQKCRRIFVS